MKSIVFCSSQRFKRDLAEFVMELKRLAGERDLHITVLEPNFENSESHLSHLPEKERIRDCAQIRLDRLRKDNRSSGGGIVYDAGRIYRL